jgi:hypothetical protein
MTSTILNTYNHNTNIHTHYTMHWIWTSIEFKKVLNLKMYIQDPSTILIHTPIILCMEFEQLLNVKMYIHDLHNTKYIQITIYTLTTPATYTNQQWAVNQLAVSDPTARTTHKSCTQNLAPVKYGSLPVYTRICMCVYVYMPYVYTTYS